MAEEYTPVVFTENPGAPSRKRRKTFATEADAFCAWLEAWSPELDQLQTALAGLQAVVQALRDETGSLQNNAAQSAISSANSASAAEQFKQLAQAWAESDTEVAAGQYSSKYWALTAAAHVAGLPDGTVNDMITSLTGTWSSQKISDELEGKADKSATYTKGEVNVFFSEVNDDVSTKEDKVVAVVVASSDSPVLDLHSGSLFKFTCNQNANISLANFDNTSHQNFVLEITYGGTYSVGWFPGITWGEGVPPVLTPNGTDILGFYWNGSFWRGLKMSKGVA